MKHGYILLFVLIFLFGCGGSDTEGNPMEDDSVGQRDSDDENPIPIDDPNPDPTNSQLLTLVQASTFGTSGSDVADRMVLGPSQNLIKLVSRESVSSLLAIDQEFNVLWEKTFSEFTFLGLRNTPDDKLIATGYTNAPTSEESDAQLTKFDELGNIIWETTIGGSKEEGLSCVTFTSDGGYIAAGSTASSDGIVTENKGLSDILVARFDQNGELVWARTFGGSNAEYSNDIIAQSNGNFIIVGATNSTDGDIVENDGGLDIWLIQIDSDGTMISSKTIGSSNADEAFSITPLQDGNYAIVGNNGEGDLDASQNNGSGDAWTVLIDQNINIIDEVSFGEADLELVRDLFELPNGDLLLTGISWSSEGIAIKNQGVSDYMVLRLSPDLLLKDTLLLGGRNLDFVSDAVLSNQNTLWLTGSTTSNDGDVNGNNGGSDIWTAKVFVPND